jgi:hypothetical protein
MTALNYITRFLILAALTIVALLAAGCGGSSSSVGSSTASSKSSASSASSATEKPFKGEPKIVKFGKPAPLGDVEAASKVLAENLEAREAADFATQCASLTPSAQGEVVGSQTPKTAQECPSKLKELATPLKETEEIRTNTFDGIIDELRLKGSRAYALYHGNDGKNWAMPLQLEGKVWKVGSIVTTELE